MLPSTNLSKWCLLQYSFLHIVNYQIKYGTKADFTL